MNNFVENNVKKNRLFYLHKAIPFSIVNHFEEGIDLRKVIDTLEKIFPLHFFREIEGVYIGEFKELKKRNIDAMYEDGVIYLSSYKGITVSEDLIVGDITHEIAHSIEKKFSFDLYADGELESEYEAKKLRLYSLLRSHEYSVPKDLFFNDHLTDELDDLLYKNIGYEKIFSFSNGLFLSPYSITTIREYFATGFEEYYLRDKKYLKQLCPVLFRKVNSLEKELR
jgi:hypothetical protein